MDIFSYHLIKAPFRQILMRLVSSRALNRVDGLRHSEILMTMKMGRSVTSPSRYNFRTLSFFAWWESESALAAFEENPPYRVFRNPSWHVRMKFYRKWGHFAELDEAPLHTEHANPEGSVVAVTLARLKLRQTLRFAKWGKPVERQIRGHEGKTCARVAFRPLRTFSTFSIWESEQAMINMVRGRLGSDGTAHRNAMVERGRNPFHSEFMTLRFVPLSHHGDWDLVRDETTSAVHPPFLLGA